MSSQKPSNSSASHWCAAVIEEVTPTATVPPMPVFNFPTKSSISSLAAATRAASSSSATSSTGLAAYEQYYAQYYNTGASSSVSSTPTALAQATLYATTNAVHTPLNPYVQLTVPPPQYSYQTQTLSNTTAPATRNSMIGYTASTATTPAPMKTAFSALSSLPVTSTSATPASAPVPYQPPPPSFTSYTAAPITVASSNANKKPNASRFQQSAATSSSAIPQAFTSASTSQAAMSHPAATAVAATKSSWPASLTAYVQRCFHSCEDEKDRSFVSSALQPKIAKITADGRLSVHRWDLESEFKLPSQIAREEEEEEQQQNVRRERERESTKRQLQQQLLEDPTHDPYSGTGYSEMKDTDRVNYNSSKAGESHDTASMSLLPAGVEGARKRKNRFEPLNASTLAVIMSAPYPSIPQNYPSFQPSPLSTSLSRDKEWVVKEVKKSKGGILEQAEALSSSKGEQEMRTIRANRFHFALEQSQPQEQPIQTGRDKKKGKKGQGSYSRNSSLSIYGPQSSSAADDDFDVESLRVVGTCEKVEKEYLRLTAAPHPSTVRPEPVLKVALAQLVGKWRSRSIEYISLCSQMKAIRQDLTVQHIQNAFTVEVYEMHARMALGAEGDTHAQDLNEYNQCQTQLMHLYARAHSAEKKGRVGLAAIMHGCEAEFVAYRILYYVYLLGNKKYQSGGGDLAFLMSHLVDRQDLCRDAAVVHALKVREAVRTDNLHIFFRLYRDTPNMGRRLLVLALDPLRLQYLQRLCRSHKPHVEAAFVLAELGFELTPSSVFLPNTAGLAKSAKSKKHAAVNSYSTAPVAPTASVGLDFLRKAGCVLVPSSEAHDTSAIDSQPLSEYVESCWDINTKDTSVDFSAVLTQDKLLL